MSKVKYLKGLLIVGVCFTLYGCSEAVLEGTDKEVGKQVEKHEMTEYERSSRVLIKYVNSNPNKDGGNYKKYITKLLNTNNSKMDNYDEVYYYAKSYKPSKNQIKHFKKDILKKSKNENYMKNLVSKNDQHLLENSFKAMIVARYYMPNTHLEDKKLSVDGKIASRFDAINCSFYRERVDYNDWYVKEVSSKLNKYLNEKYN